MSKKKISPREENAASFEESLKELEKVVAELESGKLGLSDALTRYEEGVRHLKGCQQLLESAERRIELLSGLDADGNPITQPFADEDADSLEAKGAARTGRRTSSAKPAPARNASNDDIDVVPRLF